MTKKSRDASEGWESLVQEGDSGALASNPELEEALREAAEAVDEHKEKSRAGKAHELAVSELDLIDPSGDAPSQQAAVADVQTQEMVEDLSAEVVDLKDRLLRHQAEFDNFRKRALKERQEALQYGHQNLAKDLLSAVDNLDRALEHSRASEGGDLKSLLRGVELVQKELLGALGNHGVNRVEALGKIFDPTLHEAMAQVPDGSVPPNTVLEVLEEGYQLRDRLIRPARVVVAKAPVVDDDDGGEGEGKSS